MEASKIDLLVSFDTTGSMYPVLSQVRRDVEQFVSNMFSEFSDLRLGIIAHGDYCDKDDPYTIRFMDFTRDEDRLCKFVRETEKTYGGDADECYELVLNVAHTQASWRSDADRIMIMIGDASPHSPSYRDNKDNLDWKAEADRLATNGIKVFAVHALAGWRSSSKYFYKTVAEKTLGVYLTLDQFSEIVDLIKAAVCQQSSEEKLNEFVTIIKDSGRMTHSMNNNIKRLRGEKVDDTYTSYVSHTPKRKRTFGKSDDVVIKEMDKLVPVVPGRFQVMTVDENCDIKGFVTKNGIEFNRGRGFYELTKAETVQQYKEIIMQDKETGEMFVGSQVREKLGLQPQTEKGGVNEKLYAKDAKEFRIFVQSTSVNRKLIAGTTFLYEISDIEDTGTAIKETPEVKETTTEKTVETTPKKDTPVKKTVKKTAKKTKTAEVKKDTKDEFAEHILSDKDAMDRLAEAVLGAGTDTEKKEAPADETKVPVEWEELEGVDCMDKPVVDEEKTEVKTPKKKATAKATKSKDTKKVEKSTAEKKTATAKKTKVKSKSLNSKDVERLNKAIGRVTAGLERYAKSSNKKNTEFLKNNLNKTIAAARKLIDSME